MDVKTVIKKITQDQDKIFDFLKVKVRELEKHHTRKGWLNKVGIDSDISCQDIYFDWIIDYLKTVGIEVPRYVTGYEKGIEDFDFVTELSGQIILFPVFDLYAAEMETNPFAEDLIEIWNFGDKPNLEEDYRKSFKKEIKEYIERWRKERK
jgi:hypothetical protein